jgi:outer membrane protein TolC
MLDHDGCTEKMSKVRCTSAGDTSPVLLSLSPRYGHLSLLSRLWNTEMKSKARRASKILSSNFLIPWLLLISAVSAVGQAGGLSPFSAPLPTQSTSQSNAPALNPGASINSQNPLFGSVPEGKASGQEMPLSIMDAIGLGLRHNLGLILNQVGTESARAARIRALADLLPNVTGTVRENIQQVNLAAFGVPLPAGAHTVVGPFSIFDARAALSQNLFDLHALNNTRSAGAELKAAEFTYRNARELVVLAVGSQYLQVISNMARVEAAESEVKTAQALYQQATDLQKAGVSARIDPLRSQVELQSRQQQLIVAQNDFDKSKLTLIRIIGLPVAQPITLTDRVPFEPLAAIDFDSALQRSYTRRQDYLSAKAQVEAAQLAKKAATSQRIPAVGFNADYGDIGKTPGNSHGTVTISGTVRFPIIDNGKIRADVEQADATLKQRQAELSDLGARIEFDVRTALLDIQSAAKQVEVAKSSLDLANETLREAQDRFAAGVTDNLEVVQAQDSVALANENYIGSLYTHNVAKITLAKALGIVEEAVRNYLGGKK